MKLSIIVAAARNGVIGKDGKIPWHIPEDMKHFKEITTGHIVIMGRKTYESIGRALPNRLNVVLTSNPSTVNEDVAFACDMDEALGFASAMQGKWSEEVFIIGGERVYREALPHVDKIYITQIDRDVEGDTFFPLKSFFDGSPIEEWQLAALASTALHKDVVFEVWERRSMLP